MSMLPPPAPPVPPTSGPAPKGGTLVASAWAALREDRELIALPVIGGLATLLAVAPLVLVALIPSDGSPGQVALGIAALLVAATVGTFFAVALASGAHARMNGGDPDIRSCLKVAWNRKRAVVGWALLSTTVGIVLRVIEDRVRGIGTLIRVFGDVAWTLASFFALPIIAANDVGPIDALKLSASTFKQRWNSAVRVQLRLGLYTVVLFIGVIISVLAIVAAAHASLALGLLVGLVLGGTCLVAALVLNALAAYARVALYRYAAGLPTPGFSPAMLAASVRTTR